MARIRTAKGLVGFYSVYLIALGLLGLGPVWAQSILDSRSESSILRTFGVLLGTFSLIPWIGLTAWVLRRTEDEYILRIHFVAIAIAFVGSMLWFATMNGARQAGFTGAWPFDLVWQTMALWWGIGIVVSTLYYRWRK